MTRDPFTGEHRLESDRHSPHRPQCPHLRIALCGPRAKADDAPSKSKHSLWPTELEEKARAPALPVRSATVACVNWSLTGLCQIVDHGSRSFDVVFIIS